MGSWICILVVKGCKNCSQWVCILHSFICVVVLKLEPRLQCIWPCGLDKKGVLCTQIYVIVSRRRFYTNLTSEGSINFFFFNYYYYFFNFSCWGCSRFSIGFCWEFPMILQLICMITLQWIFKFIEKYKDPTISQKLQFGSYL